MNKNKKNVLIIAYNDLNNSGVPNVIYQIIKSLNNNYSFDIIVFGENDFYYKKLLNDGITDVNLIKIKESKPKNKLKSAYWYIHKRPKELFLKTIEILKNKKYHAVHSFKEYDSWPFFKACKKMSVEKRIVHSTVNHEKTKNGLINIYNNRSKRLTLKYSSEFVGVSDLCCKIAFPNKKYTILYNGYNEAIFNSNVTNRLQKNELVITHLATFNSNKNQLFSLETIKELKSFYPNSKLKLIGKETEKGYLQILNKYIQENGLDNNVEIIDGSFGVGDNFNYTTFTILPSHKEGAGITAVESQACGIKVFASTNVTKEMDVGGIIFCDLNSGPKKWAETIYNQFQANENKRETYNMDKFSSKSFKSMLETIYK